uniref:Uncharacterized protein n=1 Tax=Anopheles minimus TaxID=112268 RepID=A0A182WH49_9DIPT
MGEKVRIARAACARRVRRVGLSSARRKIFPDGVIGKPSTNRTPPRSRLKSVTCPSTCRTMSSACSALPGLRSTTANGRSVTPSGDGIPITHTCFTPSICCMMPSRSDGDTWKLLYLMMSLMRSITYRLPSASMYPMSPLRKNPSSIATCG